MIKVIHTILLSLLVAGQVNFAYAQTASILPNAKTTFLDSNGKPLVGGKVQFYVPGTTSPKTTWQDSGETIPNTNPVILDGAGRAIILGDGNYRQVVTDRLGNLIWDQATSSTGTGGGGTTATVGDGDAVGTVKPWSGLIAPQAYVFSYGQELARASFPLLFSTITTQQNVGCTSGNATLTGLGDTSQIPVGAPVESICLNAGATVVSTTISTITVSSNAIITTNSSARIFPFGNGDGSTTFNVPDLRGRVIAGRDNMGSVAANRLTSIATGFNAIAALGATGGNQNRTLVTNNLPPYTPSGGVSSTLTSNLNGVNLVTTTGGANTPVGGGAVSVNSFVTGAQSVSSTFSGNGQGGSSLAFPIIQPTEILNYIIKTIPDSNPNSFFGVASIGGMTGILLCGTGITCSGNTISAISSTVPTPTALTLGGVFSLTCNSSNWFYQLDTTGAFGCRQPDFIDLHGTIFTGQISNNLISNVMIRQSGALSLVGRSANSTGNVADISATAGSSCAFMESGSTLVCGQLVTAGIANSAVTGAKIATNTVANSNLAQAAATTLKANPTGATANEQDVTLGSTLNFSGTTLNCTSMSATQVGCGQPDNSTIVISGGKLTAVGAAATSVGILSTTVSSGTPGQYLTTTNTGCSGTTPCLAQFSPAPIANSIASNLALSSTPATYTDGPSIAQGTTGTWYVCGNVTGMDTAIGFAMNAKLWDGTTVLDSGSISTGGANFRGSLSLCGFITNPAGNLRISVANGSGTTTASMLFNATGNSKDSTITAHRIQ